MLGKRDKEDNFCQEVMEQIIDVPVQQVAEQIVGMSVSRVMKDRVARVRSWESPFHKWRSSSSQVLLLCQCLRF